MTIIGFLYPSRSARKGLAIVGCQSGVTGSGEAESGEGKCAIGARYQRWICCSAVARLCFERLVALPQTRGVVVAGRPLWLRCSVDVCLVVPTGSQTH